MTTEQLKLIIKAVIKEARIYNRNVGTPIKTSTDYDLTPEEQLAWKGMTPKEKSKFAAKKLTQARKAKGLCVYCGKVPAIDKPDGQRGTYCQTCLDKFSSGRKEMSTKRGSCTRCPNPPEPGKKLCKKCTDELDMQRYRYLANNLCLQCGKVPPEIGVQGEKTLYCRKCMKSKVERNKRAKQKGWSGYEIE